MRGEESKFHFSIEARNKPSGDQAIAVIAPLNERKLNLEEAKDVVGCVWNGNVRSGCQVFVSQSCIPGGLFSSLSAEARNKPSGDQATAVIASLNLRDPELEEAEGVVGCVWNGSVRSGCQVFVSQICMLGESNIPSFAKANVCPSGDQAIAVIAPLDGRNHELKEAEGVVGCVRRVWPVSGSQSWMAWDVLDSA
jgi:hypothetical protein